MKMFCKDMYIISSRQIKVQKTLETYGYMGKVAGVT